MKRFQRKRLEKLATFLKTFRPTKEMQFDIGLFYLKDSCGTSACAAGLACTITSFKKAGLKLQFTSGLANITFKWHYNKNAIQEFFGLTSENTEYIFYSYSYGDNSVVTPKMVAKHIKEVLNERKTKSYSRTL